MSETMNKRLSSGAYGGIKGDEIHSFCPNQ